MSDRPALPLDRRRLLGLAGAGLLGGLTWDVVRAGGTVDVTSPDERPDASDDEIAAYVRGCTDFGLDLLSELAESTPDENVMVSPLGLSGALAMTWAGARGETEQRMRKTLQYPLDQQRLHPAIGALQYDLDKRGTDVQHRQFPRVWNVNRFELGLSNAMWGQTDYPFADAYLDTLHYYGTNFNSVDFDANAAGARRQINRWAKRTSNGHVTELVSDRHIDRYVVFVLTNSVYLRADWQQPFDPEDTRQREFTRPDGSTVSVPMMHQEGQFPLIYGPEDATEGDVTYKVVELPYVGGDVSMVLIVPRGEHTLADLEAEVDADWLESRFEELDERGAHEAMVSMPRFTFGNDLELKTPLEALGMTTAFSPADADFGGMTDPPSAANGLYIDWVFHDTHVSVDEEGTVAVAVSGILGSQVSLPPNITLDRPFLFCIRDRKTDAVLFLGRVVDPSDG